MYIILIMDIIRVEYQWNNYLITIKLYRILGDKSEKKLFKWHLNLCVLAIYLIEVIKHHCKLILSIFWSNNSSWFNSKKIWDPVFGHLMFGHLARREIIEVKTFCLLEWIMFFKLGTNFLSLYIYIELPMFYSLFKKYVFNIPTLLPCIFFLRIKTCILFHFQANKLAFLTLFDTWN
jgi:hypothetical protein